MDTEDRRALNTQLRHQARTTLAELADKVDTLLNDESAPLTHHQQIELEAVYALTEQALRELHLLTDAFTTLADSCLDDDAHRDWIAALLEKLEE